MLNKTGSKLFIILRLGICRSANWLNGAKNQQQTGKQMQHPGEGCLWALRRRHAKSRPVIGTIGPACEQRYEWFSSYGSTIGRWVGIVSGAVVRVHQQRPCSSSRWTQLILALHYSSPWTPDIDSRANKNTMWALCIPYKTPSPFRLTSSFFGGKLFLFVWLIRLVSSMPASKWKQ